MNSYLETWKHNVCQVQSLKVVPENSTRARVEWAYPHWVHNIDDVPLNSHLWHLSPLELEYEIAAVQGSTQKLRWHWSQLSGQPPEFIGTCV